jgi:hypothetical protein
MPKQKTRATRVTKPANQSSTKQTPPATTTATMRKTHNNILDMQRQYGNAYVQRYLIQRAPPDETVAEPEAVDETEALREEIYDDYITIRDELYDSHTVNYTIRRRDLINKWGLLVANLDEKSPDQLESVRSDQLDMQEKMADETLDARASWENLESWYVEDMEILQNETDYASVIAMDLLTKEYEATKKNVDADKMWWLVEEDLLGLSYMLENGTHITKGEELAAEEEMENAEVLAGLDPDEEEEPGMLETAWDVFGWDSFGDFAIDAVLTIGTAGIGKAARYGYKAHKARKKYKRLRKAQKLLKAKKIAKAANGADEMIKLVSENAGEQIELLFTWLKSNWRKVAKKVSSDLIAEGIMAEEGVENIGTDIAERATKEYLGKIVSEYLGKDSKWERKMARHAFAASVSKRTRRRAKSLFIAYFSQNAKRRILTNALHKSLIETSSFENPLTATWLEDVLITSAGEMAQDLVAVLPLFDNSTAEYLLETVRKSLMENFKR